MATKPEEEPGTTRAGPPGEAGGRHRCEVELVVPFHDVDSMQVVWHGHYLKYFEIARGLLFERAGIDLYRLHSTTGYIFPVVRTSVKHIRPLRYRDRFICTATVADLKRKMVVDFEIRLSGEGGERGPVCARGRTEQVAIRSFDFRLEVTIPAEIRAAFGETVRGTQSGASSVSEGPHSTGTASGTTPGGWGKDNDG